MGSDVVVLAPEAIKRALLPAERAARRGTGRLLQRQVHPLVATVLLRLPGVDPFELDAKAGPPSRQLGEPCRLRDGRERLAVVRPDGLRQTELSEQRDEHAMHVVRRRLVKPDTRQQVPRRRVHHGQRITATSIARRKLPLEVDAPYVIRLATRREWTRPGGHAIAPPAGRDHPVALEDGPDRGGRWPLVLRPMRHESLPDRHRSPARELSTLRQDQLDELARGRARTGLGPTRTLLDAAVLLVPLHPLVSGLTRDAE